MNVYAKLKNQPNWRETLGRIRLVFGDVDDVLIQPDPSGGTLGLEVRWGHDLEVPLSALSDGQVSALALIAIQQLRRKVAPSLIVIDEPEAHLHPGVTRRVAVGLAETGDEWPMPAIISRHHACIDRAGAVARRRGQARVGAAAPLSPRIGRTLTRERLVTPRPKAPNLPIELLAVLAAAIVAA